jgi:hypothetical protein
MLIQERQLPAKDLPRAIKEKEVTYGHMPFPQIVFTRIFLHIDLRRLSYAG